MTGAGRRKSTLSLPPYVDDCVRSSTSVWRRSVPRRSPQGGMAPSSVATAVLEQNAQILATLLTVA